ncbi:MAG: DNA polymerase II large subunit [Candidatus Micrarchaeia archaeon]|jgi:DNA polymerase II large subunit
MDEKNIAKEPVPNAKPQPQASEPKTTALQQQEMEAQPQNLEAKKQDAKPKQALECSPYIQKYFDMLTAQINDEYAIASKARKMGLDPEEEVEITPAPDVAARVEGLVGPVGIAACIRRINEEQAGDREKTCFGICHEIIEGKFDNGKALSTQQRIEQAVRSGLALFTEGVVSAPIEGVSKVEIRKNFDGSNYVAVFFSGPIRAAGGTGQAFTVILGDVCRKFAGISDYRATESEVERYVEELGLYARKTRAGQYVPTSEEIQSIVRNCPVCIAGDATEDYEVSKTKNIPTIDTNRVRSGVCLVLSEGMCLKAAKVLKISKKAGLSWDFIQSLIKVAKTDPGHKMEIKPIDKFMHELVAGRPIFSYPMRPGGLRLRFGRTRLTGIASKALHPATMEILHEYPAIGTQVKVERPGKGCIVTPCQEIDGPIVRLKNGDVVKVESEKQAFEVRPQVEQILFLGDLLVNYGDFLKANHPIVPSPWCEEWYGLVLESKGLGKKTFAELYNIPVEESLALARNSKVPLAPRHTFFYHDLSADETIALCEWLATGKVTFDWFEFRDYKIANQPEKKILLERLGVQHQLSEGEIIIEGEWARALLETLGLLKEKALDAAKAIEAKGKHPDSMALVNALAGFEVKKKATVYVGASMGRPEKAKERKMEPPVHVLFPIGDNGGKMRDIVKAKKNLADKTIATAELEVANNICPQCNKKTFYNLCPQCKVHAKPRYACEKCSKPVAYKSVCECGGRGSYVTKHIVDVTRVLEQASNNVNYAPKEIKGVIGLISETKSAEPLEKGILREKHGTYVFRDGTCRFDATEVPITHFYPYEIGATILQLKKMGYDHDAYGKPLENEEQLVELLPQDIILNEYGGNYFSKITGLVDDELFYMYGQRKHYFTKTPSDLIGKLGIALAPHTSAGIVVRIIGFTKVKGLLCHPYVHCACRRNTDGDELCLILLLDGLLNFSKRFLPVTRGGQMDAPLVLTTLLDPREVDDEVHAMDSCWNYPLEFYENSENMPNPSDVKIETIKSRLGKPSQYESIGFTHNCTMEGPTESRYVQLGDMQEKLAEELALMETIRSVDFLNATERVILSHFIPDTYGNLRKFTRQKFRCAGCNQKYRRVPLIGKCRRCGGKILLTINKGGIEKYLQPSLDLIEKYHLPDYLKQRLELVKKEIASIFEDENSKQYSLANFV